MNEVNYDKKIKLSNKIYPLFFGFSGDLLFWIAINTIFLTTVKGFNAAQISSFTTVGNLVAITLYPISIKIIEKIGNIKSIKLGTILLLCSALLFTFSNQYFLILIGHILYDLSFFFKNMDNVILRKNLKYENREKEYIKVQNKSSFIYSILTMIIAFIAGFLFNINNYLPMLLCICCCIFSVILAHLLYEYRDDNYNEIIEKNAKDKLSFTKIIFFILLLYASVYATIDLGQANGKLFIQYKLSSFLDISEVTILLSFIIAISRVVRVISNYIFTKYCKGENSKLLYKIGYALIIAFICIILGSLMNFKFIGICFMALGFFVFLGTRDLFANYTKTLLLNNCNEEYHEQAITYLTLSRKAGKFIISGLITLLLLKIDMLYIMMLLLLISTLNIFIIKKIYKLVEGGNKFE